jgi:dihydrofolate reductase
MRKVIATTFVSLDGVMQAPGAPNEDTSGGFKFGGWMFPFSDVATDAFLGEQFEKPFDLLLGRNTYDIFAAHWPYMGDNPIAVKFNAITKYVATSSTEPLTWQNSVALRGNVPAEVRKLKQGEGPPLLLQGSGKLIQALLANDLIDEFNLLIFPLLLGPGKKLFAGGTMPAALKLTGSRTGDSGVIIARYVRDGAVRTGSFAVPEPVPEAEVKRRERMKREG